MSVLPLIAALMASFGVHASPGTYTLGDISFPLNSTETVPAGEVEAIESTSQLFDRFFAQHYAKPTEDKSTGLTIHGTRRGVHPRAHGCLYGSLEVDSGIWEMDQTSVFKPGKIYPIIARFSNADPRGSADDFAPDSRGFAFKIQGVEGDRVLPSQYDPEIDSQVFTFNSSDRFFANNAENYRKFMNIALFESKNFSEAATQFVLGLVKELDLSLANRIRLAFQGIRDVKVSNVLGINFFSISARMHGTKPGAHTAKYAALPCEGAWYNKKEVDSKNPFYLRKNLKERMAKQDACFVFAIQRNPENSWDVEDLTRRWDPDVAPFERIALIRFPRQELMDDSRCERETFNPWTTVTDHRPLGGINRMRLGSYLHSIRRRQGR
ncbi:MAG: catalase [Bdellovibrionales bacterium]